MAGDVLCYFGQLDDILTAIHARPASNGLLIFSVESLAISPDIEDAGREWKLLPTGRYAHAADYIAETARRVGLHLRSIVEEPLRYQDGLPVEGPIVVLERPVDA